MPHCTRQDYVITLSPITISTKDSGPMTIPISSRARVISKEVAYGSFEKTCEKRGGLHADNIVARMSSLSVGPIRDTARRYHTAITSQNQRAGIKPAELH
ncbi:hypothetical protein G5I_07435 [Acromyrmex echinatior]|uniref:Uncharacterized protein n=1 Tax=Acromyrmex echinatior TaxID=103372 RepID=F4WNT1_ACREC|nr:hypothetical protein G5I_07435 [Acromyrmex echinatior]